MDAAFLAHAVLRAPNELWKKLDGATRKNLARRADGNDAIFAGQNNWLLFAATVQTALP